MFDLEKAFTEVETKLNDKFTKFENELKEHGSVSAATKGDVKKLAEDFNGLQKDVTQWLEDVKSKVTATTDDITALKQKRGTMDLPTSAKSIGQEVIESEGFEALQQRKTKTLSVELKNTILGESGSPQQPDTNIAPRFTMPGIVPGAFRMLRLADLVPQGVTSSNNIYYVKETAFTNNAAETPEGTTKPESVITFGSVDTPVRTIAHFIRASKQILDDAPALQSYIDARMRYGVLLKKEQAIIAAGGAQTINGLAATGNHTDLTVLSGANDFDAANVAKYQVIGNDYMPDFYLINPADWGRMERLKTGIAGDASYAHADGTAISYIANGLQPLLWGLPVVLSNSVTAGTFYCVSRDAVMLWNRAGVTVDIFEQDADNVQKNLLTIRAEMRCAFTVFHAGAVIEGTWPDAA